MSNVWRFGDLELDAVYGRLLLRGPNGTGKTTALEALFPFLFELDGGPRMAAGRGRSTTLAQLMRDGADGKRKCGYAWLTFGAPDGTETSYGARLVYSESGSPIVRVEPFMVPGRPLRQLKLYGTGKSTLSPEEFASAIEAAGGRIFEDEESYRASLTEKLLNGASKRAFSELVNSVRFVRNPANLADVSPAQAADLLKGALPVVESEIIAATAEALAESDVTHEAFKKDEEAAILLADFRDAWVGHVVDVVQKAHNEAATAARKVTSLEGSLREIQLEIELAQSTHATKSESLAGVTRTKEKAETERRVLEASEDYARAGRLKELQRTLLAQRAAAAARIAAMAQLANGARIASRSVQDAAASFREDLKETVAQVTKADPTVASLIEFSCSTSPRAPLSAGDQVVDPGPEVVIRANPENILDAASAWKAAARRHEARANAAALAMTDYERHVGTVEKELSAVREESARAKLDAEQKAQQQSSAEREAQFAARAMVEAFVEWQSSNSGLLDELGWDRIDEEDWTELTRREPAEAVTTFDELAREAQSVVEKGTLSALQDRQRSEAHAAELEGEAARLREEAARLLSGEVLLPFPRPAWAGVVDDDTAFGAALEFAEGFEDPRQRALLELAVGASGLLGATFIGPNLGTPQWSVDATGPFVEPSLAQVLRVDPEHPRAHLAGEVLRRIPLVSSVRDPRASSGAVALEIGLDGTFRAGVLLADAVADREAVGTAVHIGARQRRFAALQRATELQRQADALTADAAKFRAEAESAGTRVDAISKLGDAVPDRNALRNAEALRVVAAGLSRDASRIADEKNVLVESTSRRRHAVFAEWCERTRRNDLPPDTAELAAIRSNGMESAATLNRLSTQLSSTLISRLRALLAQTAEATTNQALTRSESEAREAVGSVEQVDIELKTLTESAGKAIADVLARAKELGQAIQRLALELRPLAKEVEDAGNAVVAAKTRLKGEQKNLEEARGAAEVRLAALRALLHVAGVADAVGGGPLPEDPQQLIAHLAPLLRNRKTSSLKAVRDRAEKASGILSGTWRFDAGEGLGELFTWVLQHGELTYSPTQAAVRAEALSRKAKEALAVSEEKALRDFIIGRLPSAIADAWTRLNDWIKVVNVKMREASASSGLSVRVRTQRRADLSPQQLTVHAMTCEVSDADRTAEQTQKLSDALQSLIRASPYDSMAERVADAVDVREWIDVHYVVIRPDGTEQRWGARTGLSTGERRLVVLAPMLAAAAAKFDSFGASSLRLVALDEVPTEVDEKGREGLARFIAALDLDLISTSHGWDGSPGAWDGIDAYDLEAGPDGTVVGFPMLVRGRKPKSANEAVSA